MLEEIPAELPPVWNINDCTDLIPTTVIPNKAAYWMSAKDHDELQWQISELMKKC